MQSLISVVIPVYNVQKYLKNCLDSVVNQTYKNLQIIIIDDGSTDSSGAICDEYAEKDSRIVVIHQKNQGAGSAKNSGLELIKGDYFSIIDSDDYIELNTYEKMIEYMEKNNVDMVQCLFRKKYMDGSVNVKYLSGETDKQKMSATDFLQGMLNDWKYAVFWNKLFKRELLADVRFPENRKIDDEFFTYKLVCNAKDVLNVTDIFYNYRIRKTSVMNESKNDRLISDRIDCFDERFKIISDRYPKLKKLYYRHFSELLIIYHKNTCNEELKCKIENFMKKFPYKKPPITEKIKSKLTLHTKSVDSNNEDTGEKNYQSFD